MAQEIINLQAVVRTGTGKGAARQARREGNVPGIVYGDNKEPVSINLNFNYLLKRLRQGRFLQTLFNLQVEGQDDVKVICRNVQRDVVRDLPAHIDFMRVHNESRIELYIPVEFLNADKAPGIKRGGVLTVAHPQVKLEVLASAIPDQITVDLEGKKIGDAINLSDLALPEGVVAPAGKDFAVATIIAPSGLVASSDDE